MKNIRFHLNILVFLTLAHTITSQNTDNRQFFKDTWKSKTYQEPETVINRNLSASTNIDAHIIFQPDVIISKVLPTHFGVNTTFRNGNKQLERTNLYTNAGIGSMRYPAGSGSNIYYYDGNIPDDFRIDFNPINGTKSSHMTPELFVQFKQNTNSEATVVVNYFYARYGITPEGTREARVQQAAEYAAGFVKKLNVELKANIKYWEIGNECYGKWEEGYEIDGVVTTGKEYGEDFCVFADAMKGIDPDIKIGAVVTREDDDWNSSLLPEIQDHADFLAVHNYFTTVKDATAENVLGSIPQIESVHTALLDCIEKYTEKPRNHFPVAMTEFNSRGPINCTMVNGIFITQVLAESIKNGYGMVDLWVSEWNWNETDQESKGFLAKNDPQQADYSPRQSYIPYQYFKSNFGDQMIASSSDNTNIKVYASNFSSGEVGLIIINTGDTEQAVKIDYMPFETNEVDAYWHEFYANTIEAGDKKFYINGQTGTTTGGGPDNYQSIAPYKATLNPDNVFITKKYSVNFMVLKSKPKQTKHNVLMIAIDDLKPLLNCYGETGVKTPNIDRLAQQGIVFTKAYCQWAVCGPSRASIMSGQTPDGTGIRNLSSLLRTENPDIVTLPEYFLNNGYTTAACGKVYDPRNVDDSHDIYSWSIPYTQPSTYSYPESYPPFVQGSNYRVSENTATEQGPEGVGDDGYTDGQIALDALSKLDKMSKNSAPFFLAVGFKKPHIPFIAPKKYWDMYERNKLDLAPFQQIAAGSPEYAYHTPELIGYDDIPDQWTYNDAVLGGEILSPDKQRELLHGYYACVSYIDAQVGKLLDKLEEKGLSDNTVILLFGDHGYHLGDHNQWGKHTQFENSVRAPLIISSPNGISGKNETPVEFTDIYPTLCEMAGLDVPIKQLQGNSLAPALRGEQLDKDIAVSEYRAGGGSSYSFRSSQYRLTLWMKSSNDRTDQVQWDENRIKAMELYDYNTDPLEKVNLINDQTYTSVIDDLKSKAQTWWNKQYNFFNTPTSPEITIPYTEHFENYLLNTSFSGDNWLNAESLWERLWQSSHVNSFSAHIVDDQANSGTQALEINFNPKAENEGGKLIKLRTINMEAFESKAYIVSYKARTNTNGSGKIKVGANSNSAEWHTLTNEYTQYFDHVTLNNDKLFIIINNVELPSDTDYHLWIDDIKVSYALPTLADNEKNSLKTSLLLYPNPVESILYFQYNQPIESSIIYNCSGQIVKQNHNTHSSVNLANLAKGIYFIELFSKGAKSVHKIIKR